MQTVYSSRLEKIVCDIIFDFETKARLADKADKSGIAKQVEEFEKTAKKEIHRRAL